MSRTGAQSMPEVLFSRTAAGGTMPRSTPSFYLACAQTDLHASRTD